MGGAYRQCCLYVERQESQDIYYVHRAADEGPLVRGDEDPKEELNGEEGSTDVVDVDEDLVWSVYGSSLTVVASTESNNSLAGVHRRECLDTKPGNGEQHAGEGSYSDRL